MIRRAARLYVSPSSRPLTAEERETRRLSYALKEWTAPEFQAAIDTAAPEMAALIEGPCYLVPVPSSAGCTEANKRLAQAIARHVQGARVKDGLLQRRAPVESSCNRHRNRKGPLSVQAHGFRRDTRKWLDAVPLYFVDNTTTSGNTLRAANAAFGFGEGIAFSDAGRPAPA